MFWVSRYDIIDRVEDKSDYLMKRARVYFKNGRELSIIQDKTSYGGDKGLFEIMPSEEEAFDNEDQGETILGYLTEERVQYYIDKIGRMERKPMKLCKDCAHASGVNSGACSQVFYSPVNELTGDCVATFEDDKPILRVITLHGGIAVIRLGDWIAKEPKTGCYYPIQDEYFRNNFA